MQLRRVKAIPPYIHPEYLNFKTAPFLAWKEITGSIANAHYPWRCLHGVFFRYELPFAKYIKNCIKVWLGANDKQISNQEARLCFVEPISISFDTFPSYITHEVIPFIWDCWPCYYDKMEEWLKRYEVKTAIFTSRQEMEAMKQRCPNVNMLWCPEGIDTSLYTEGKELINRSIDILEFGRSNTKVFGQNCSEMSVSDSQGVHTINHICTKVGDSFIYDNEQLYAAMGDAKVTICLPRSITHPDVADGVETLTQRYWECMLSRMVMVGHAPQELIDIIGYNPCIEIEQGQDAIKMQIINILEHIEDYQALVDKNRETAMQHADWKIRMQMVRDYLQNNGYVCM